jgi:hypothetical protein
MIATVGGRKVLMFWDPHCGALIFLITQEYLVSEFVSPFHKILTTN